MDDTPVLWMFEWDMRVSEAPILYIRTGPGTDGIVELCCYDQNYPLIAFGRFGLLIKSEKVSEHVGRLRVLRTTDPE